MPPPPQHPVTAASAAATSSHSSTVESWSGGGGSGAPGAVTAGFLRGAAPAAEEDCRSYCGSSSSVLCEDGASGAGAGDEAAAPPRCSPLPFDLNVADPEAAAAADEMDWRCDTLLHL